MVYSALWAVDGVGLQSQTVFSNGVIIDTTAPMSVPAKETDDNIALNPSFEQDIVGFWSVDNTKYTLETGIPHDGVQYICLRDNAIHQVIPSTETGASYRVSFAAKRNDTNTPRSSASFFVEAAFSHEMYVLSDKSNKNDSFYDGWIHHPLYVTATRMDMTIRLGTAEQTISVCFDNIEVHHISDQTESGDSSTSVHVRFITSSESSNLVATWNIADPESPIVDSLVALGTVQGFVFIFSLLSVITPNPTPHFCLVLILSCNKILSCNIVKHLLHFIFSCMLTCQ